MRRFIASLVLALLASSPALAGKKAANQAEVRRLWEDSHRLVKKGAWSGVERAYLQMLTLERKGAEVTHDMHVMGARAAEQRGDIYTAWERLKRAQAIETQMETLTWLATLEATYSRFVIEIHPSFQGEITLASLDPVFDPVHRSTIEAAQATLQENRYLEGLLPLGRYRLAGTVALDSYGGDTQQVVLRANRATVDDPSVLTLEMPDLPDRKRVLTLVASSDVAAEAWGSLTDTLQADLLRVEGVQRVEVQPVPVRRYFADFDPPTLQGLGLDGQAIATAVSRRFALPEGAAEVGARQVVLPTDDIGSLDALGQTEIPIEDVVIALNTLVRLREGPSGPPAGLALTLTGNADPEQVQQAVQTLLDARTDDDEAALVFSDGQAP